MEIYYTAVNERGMELEENQDAVFCGSDGQAGIFMVADGMGGHEDGARASGVLEQNIQEWWEGYLAANQRPGFLQVVEQVKLVLSQSNTDIMNYTKQGQICGSTVVVLWIEAGAWALFSCGDSRCYQMQEGMLSGKINLLTMDDVWENQQNNVAGMKPDEIKNHVNYGKLIRAVGVRKEFGCMMRSDIWRGKTNFALCSDGVYKYCGETFLKKHLRKTRKTKNLKACADKVKEEVYRNGAPDNLSLILIGAIE